MTDTKTSPVTDEIGAGNDETVHQVNARLRYAWLEAVRDRNVAREAGDTRAAAAAEQQMEFICGDFFTRNRNLAMAGARDFLGNSSYDADYEQIAMMALWEAFAGTDPEKMYHVTERNDGTFVAKVGWDPSRSTFGGFSRQFIRGGVARAVASYESGMTYNMWGKRPEMLGLRTELEAKLGRTPSVSELAKASGLPEASVRAILTPKAISADTPLGDGTMTLLDTLSEQLVDDQGDTRDLMSQMVAETADQMKPVDLFALLMRKGLLGLPGLPVVDVASRLGIGRGTVTAGVNRAWKHLTVHVEDTYGSK